MTSNIRTVHAPNVTMKQQLTYFIKRWAPYDLFFTLTMPSHSLSPEQATERFARWQQMLFRKTLGHRWQKYTDEWPLMFAAFERPQTNPHWHILCRLYSRDEIEGRRERHKSTIIKFAEPLWAKLVPSSEVDIREVYDDTIPHYLMKEINGNIQYTHFIIPDQFAVNP